MPVGYWLCVISIIFWIYMSYILAKKKEDYLYPGVVFCILFVISYPLKLIFSFYGFHVLDSMVVDQTIVISSIFIFNFAALIFLLPLMLQSKIKTSRDKFEIISFSPFVMILLVFLLQIISEGFSAFFAIFSLESLQSRIGERANERVGSGLVSLLGYSGFFLTILLSIKLGAQKKYKILVVPVLIVYSIFTLLISGSKYEALLFPCCFFIVYFYIQRSEGIDILNFKKLLLGSLGGLFLIGFFGYIRGVGAWEGESNHPFLLQSLIQLTNSFDAPDNLIVLLDRADTWVVGGIGFRLIFDYLFLPFIPRFIWSGKPLVQGNQVIMEEFFPERFGGHLGEAISPSFPGEMLLTGGLVYMCVWLLILGALYGRLYFLAQTKGGLYFIVYVWSLLNIFNFMRSGTGCIGSLMLFFLVSVATYLCLEFLHKVSQTPFSYKKSVDYLTGKR